MQIQKQRKKGENWIETLASEDGRLLEDHEIKYYRKIPFILNPLNLVPKENKCIH